MSECYLKNCKFFKDENGTPLPKPYQNFEYAPHPGLSIKI